MLAVDVSNYTGPVSIENLQAWWDSGIRLVIIQAFPPSQSAKYQNQVEQEQACVSFGIPFEIYIYDYLTDPQWRADALSGLVGTNADRIWMDEEDTTAKGLSPTKRTNAIAASLQAVTDAGFTRGIYTGRWWWTGYLANPSRFSAEPLWDANYDGIADATADFVPYGGWSQPTMKQYQGTSTLDGVSQVDLDVTA